MIIGLLTYLLNFNSNWLSDVVHLVFSWGNNQGERVLCRSRSAIEKLIVRQRNVATELTNTMSSAISATDNLESTMTTYLPPGDTLSTTLSSPQFSQALSMFWSALQSGQAGPVVQQFGLGADAISAAATGNLEEFVTALESEIHVSSNVADQSNDDAKTKAGKTDSQDNSTAGKKNDEDDEMALD